MPVDAKGSSSSKGGGKKGGKPKKGKGTEGDGSHLLTTSATPGTALKTEWCPQGPNCQSMLTKGYCERYHDKGEFRELKQKYLAQAPNRQAAEPPKQLAPTNFEASSQPVESVNKTLEAAQAEWAAKSGAKGKGKTKQKGKD